MNEQYKNPKRTLTAGEVLDRGAGLLAEFGITADPAEQASEFAEALKQADPRFKGDRTLVRFELEKDQAEWPDQTKTVIMGAAESIGMLKPETPLRGAFDVVVSLGAARQANLDRLRYAASAERGGSARIRQLIAAGSARRLNEAEQQNTAIYAPGAQTEFDLCAAAVKTVSHENAGLIAGMIYIDDEKASTSMVIAGVLDQLKAQGRLTERTKLGAVTTQIYQPFTAIDVARVAHDYGIERTLVAGNRSDPNIIANRTTATYLSEVLRTLGAASLTVAENARQKRELLQYQDEYVTAHPELGLRTFDEGLLIGSDNVTMYNIDINGKPRQFGSEENSDFWT